MHIYQTRVHISTIETCRNFVKFLKLTLECRKFTLQMSVDGYTLRVWLGRYNPQPNCPNTSGLGFGEAGRSPGNFRYRLILDRFQNRCGRYWARLDMPTMMWVTVDFGKLSNI